MKSITALLILTSLCLTAVNGISQAGERYHPHSDITTAVETFLQQLNPVSSDEFEISVGHIDSRLNLHTCEQPLDTFLAPGQKPLGKTTVGVRCQGPRPWALYVPATINRFAMVYQTTGPLTKGHMLREQDITRVKANLASLNYGYFTDASALIGKQLTRRLTQSKILTPSLVKEPLLVKRGEQVDLIAESERFAIRMSGQAMMNGNRGDKIRVKNLSSQRIIEGIVTQRGEVTVLN
ncbi:MAG: flagellar basal body P-ring formation protein FlgA [Gammaproteobacteria bacterium]|nr:MAG: flagellar basal body P-ring formation protein FlgA [Gammaproteobacteria bacterium]